MMLSLSMAQGGLGVAGFSSQGATVLSTGDATSPADKLPDIPNVTSSRPVCKLFTMNSLSQGVISNMYAADEFVS